MRQRVNATAKKFKATRKNLTPKILKFDSSQTASSPISQILLLQTTIGNQAVQKLFKSGVIQAKLKISQPNDIYEAEADRVADRMMRMSDPCNPKRIIGTKHPHNLYHQAEYLKSDEAIMEKNILLIKGTSCNKPERKPDVQSQIASLRCNGEALPKSVRSFFEPRFGRDLSQVRIHKDTRSVGLVRMLNAQAFTVGRDIVFGEGRFAPETIKGRRLIAHELTHVLQQKKADIGEQIQTFRLPIPRILGIPDIYIEPIPHTHPLVPCVTQPVTHIGVVARRKGLLSTGKGKILFDLHIGFYKDVATSRVCFVIFESKATKFCLKSCFPNWKDLKKAWKKIRDAIAKALKYIFAAIGIAVAAWLIYLIANAIATALVALLAVLAVA